MGRVFGKTRRRDALTAATAAALTLLTVASVGLAVQQAPPRNTSSPTISGAQRVGNTLTANPGTWTGTAPITFTYQWIRCNSQMANCQNTGVTTRTYRLTPDDLGRRLLVVVTARNAEGTAQARATTRVIQRRGNPPRNTAPPTISGTPREGEVLTATPGTWTGAQPITFSYQWLRCDANGGSCVAISGARAQTYSPTSADVGRTLRVRVTARNAGGSRFATSVPTGVVQRGGPGGQIRLPNGKISIPIENVSLPTKLVIDEYAFSPNPVRSRTRPFTVRVHVSDTRGFVVRGAVVFIRSTPLLTTTPPETPTGVDGWVTVSVRPLPSRPFLVFPLRAGVNVQFFLRARKPGERVLFGVTGYRLVQVRTAR